MLPIFTADEMRRVDQRAIRELGLPGVTLMENAGRGAAECIVDALPRLALPRRGARVAIVCGKGGNGGDGFVVARLPVLVDDADGVTDDLGGGSDGVRRASPRALRIALPRCARRDWRETYGAILADFVTQAAALPAGR